jgi:hypothetical protein
MLLPCRRCSVLLRRPAEIPVTLFESEYTCGGVQ